MEIPQLKNEALSWWQKNVRSNHQRQLRNHLVTTSNKLKSALNNLRKHAFLTITFKLQV